jgi:ABC-2 type transport system ATP-binding protein
LGFIVVFRLLASVDNYKLQLSMYICILPFFASDRYPGGGIRMSSRNGVQSSPNGIEVNGLVREFKGSVRAVDGIDLEVRPGEIYGFLGPNGAGKSTTVHMLTTLLPPTAGSAKVAGFDVVKQGADVRDAIGAALQEAALDPNLTARDHMRLQGALHGMSKADRTRRGDELIERVGLADAADRKVGGYSGGMKRRLDLALALLHGPRVLFLDEPTTGLDIQSRSALWDEVAHLSRDEGMTVFLTTQYLEEADQLADHLGIIDHGKIVAAGTPEKLKAEVGRPTVEVVPTDHAERDRAVELLRPFGELVPGTPQGAAVRLESDGGEELANIIRAFDQAGVKVANLELHEASLNDVFLTKTGRSLEGAQREAEEGETGEQPALEGAAA